jgi:23S rRNA pseudouridine1911/1915/1917 synthase
VRPAASLLRCWLETGRTHQIRVHLSHVGHPLIGDPLYGRSRRRAPESAPEAARAALAAFPRQALHAATLGFRHPATGDPVRFEAPPPADFAGLLDILRRNFAHEA